MQAVEEQLWRRTAVAGIALREPPIEAREARREHHAKAREARTDPPAKRFPTEAPATLPRAKPRLSSIKKVIFRLRVLVYSNLLFNPFINISFTV